MDARVGSLIARPWLSVAFQKGPRLRGIEDLTSLPRRKAAEGRRKPAEVKRGRLRRRKAAEGRRKPAEVKDGPPRDDNVFGFRVSGISLTLEELDV